MSARGRPSKYQRTYPKQARKLSELGATDRDLAEFFEVNTSTIWRWQVEHLEFCNAVRVGKSVADERVVRALYQRAVGYSFDSKKIMQYEGSPVVVDYVEHCPPDVNAIKLWLTNRAPAEWRDKQDHEHNVGDSWVDVWKRLGELSAKTAGAAT